MKNGFSLVELSIVLVILGLLVGGILAGQSLIRAAELRSVTTEYGRYITAAQSFRDKYFYLPGDLANAQSFWGTATNCPGVETQGSTTQATCNGDGNGKINAGIWSIAATSNESFRFWQHLANAGLIEGTYDGVRGSATEYYADTSNSPRSRIGSSVVWFPWNWNGYAGDGNVFNLTGKSNIMVIGGSTTDSWPITGFLKPEELWNIDKKMDDGMPARGGVIAVLHQSCTSSSGNASDFNAVYRLDYTISNACGAMFTGGF